MNGQPKRQSSLESILTPDLEGTVDQRIGLRHGEGDIRRRRPPRHEACRDLPSNGEEHVVIVRELERQVAVPQGADEHEGRQRRQNGWSAYTGRSARKDVGG